MSATNFSNQSLHFPSIPTTHIKSTHHSSINHTFHHQFPHKNPTRHTLIIICGSTIRPKRNSKPDDNAEAQELARTILKNFNYEKPLLSTMNKYVKLVRTEHCFLLFEELGKSDKWLQCLEVFRWMQKQRWYVADNGVYSKLISVMGKKGQTRMAMWLFSEMRNSGCRPDTSVYNSLITAHLHSKDKPKALSKALGYFDKMKGTERCKPSIVTYNILLRASAQAKDVAQVEALFKDLDESVCAPDVYTFNGVMDAYGKNGMVNEMERVLSRMKSDQVKPDIITYNLLIDSYGRKQEFEKMEQVFKSLLRSKERPTVATFNSMITNYEYGLGSEMTSSGDVYSFGILLLEVITGKRPTDDIFNDGLNLHQFAYTALHEDRVTDVLDDDLLNFHQDVKVHIDPLNHDEDDEVVLNSKTPNTKKIEECMTSILKIGVLCSLDSPPQRMNIKNVVNELQRAMDTL